MATVTGEQESIERGSNLNVTGAWAHGAPTGGAGGQGARTTSCHDPGHGQAHLVR